MFMISIIILLPFTAFLCLAIAASVVIGAQLLFEEYPGLKPRWVENLEQRRSDK
jgi:hypothetical protein